MEEEIDLRPYIEALLRNWKWIIAAAVVAGLLALAISFVLPPTYEATALVAVTDPRQIVKFDPRIQASDEDLPFKAYPELATSDELLLSLLSEISAHTPDVTSLEDLQDLVSAESGSDPSLLRLTAKYGDAQVASEISNKWAELFVVKANELFGNQGNEQLGYFETQLVRATQELQLAEQDQIAFAARNRSTILDNELKALQQTQADQLAKQRQISLLLQDAETLHEQLTNTSDGKAAPSADQLALVLLQLRAFGGVSSADSGTPWQLQVNVDQLSNADQKDQAAFLFGLQNTMAAQVSQINEQLAALEPQILAVQQDKEESVTEAERLSRNLDLAKETYTALASKVQEEKITSQNTTNGARLASRSAVPEEPSGLRKLMIIAVALMLGTFLCILVIIVITWWRA